jgi:hypothetical protein
MKIVLVVSVKAGLLAFTGKNGPTTLTPPLPFPQQFHNINNYCNQCLFINPRSQQPNGE